MARIIALDILKAAPQHAQDIGATGLAMLLAITARWDSLGGTVAVKWSNRTLADRSGLSPHSVPSVRKRLIDLGWITYQQAGMHAGRYTPHIPSYHVQAGLDDIEYVKADTRAYRSPTQEHTGHLHKSIQVTDTSTFTSPTQEILSYIPSPEPSPEPSPILEKAAARPKAKVPVCNNPPTVEQVREYIEQLGYGLDAQDFHDGNTRGGWTYGKGGKSLVYDWKAHVRTWETWRKKNTPQELPVDPGAGFEKPEMPQRMRRTT